MVFVGFIAVAIYSAHVLIIHKIVDVAGNLVNTLNYLFILR